MTSSSGIVVGLVGPVCAGKSLVAARLRELGAELYQADAVVRSLYEQDDVKQEVRALLGGDVFHADGSVNRVAIADRVFEGAAGDELRRRLTDQILFPRTGAVLQAKLAEFRARAGPRDVLVLDAPTLFEAGRAHLCDRILWVTAPLERRQQWAAARGWSPAELQRRDHAMWPETLKRQRAHHEIDNAGTRDELLASVDRLWASLHA